MTRLALTLSYDGSRFAGWQTQPSRDAVQDCVEAALRVVAGEPIATICAGRTDAGVHALRQVIHFDTAAARPLSAWVRGVNSHLPEGVAVRAAQTVAPDFHARFGALRRRYRYLLHVSPVRHPLLAGRAGWSFRDVDTERMSEAAALLMGEHDFSAFRSSQCQAASPVRRLEELGIERNGALVSFCVTGNAFLHHMVRNIVGLLVMIGTGRREPAWAAQVLAGRDRRVAAPTFDAAGLYLEGVQYDASHQLPSWGGSLATEWLA